MKPFIAVDQSSYRGYKSDNVYMFSRVKIQLDLINLAAGVGHAGVGVLDVSALATLQLGTGSETALALLGDVAGTAQVLLGVFVVDEEFAVLAVAVGLVSGDGDHVENAGGLVEDGVHFLEGAVGGLGVEEVDDGEDERVARGYC